MNLTKISFSEVEKKELKVYGLLMGSVIIGLFGLVLPLAFSSSYRIWPWALGCSFIFMALFYPYGLRTVRAVWMRFGHVMGKINTTVILSVVYFVLFVPMALIMKVIGRDRLVRVWKKDTVSYRVKRIGRVEKESWERPF